MASGRRQDPYKMPQGDQKAAREAPKGETRAPACAELSAAGLPHTRRRAERSRRETAWRAIRSFLRPAAAASVGGVNPIQELRRLASPAPKPQSLAWDGATLWMGSRQTRRIYGIDPVKWTVGWETAAPGTPWGMTAIGGELRVLCGETVEDNRILRRCVPGRGFDEAFGLPCPDDTGSQLGWDGRRLCVSQWYPKKLLTLSDTGKVERVITVPHGICGQVWVDGKIYLITTDAEETTEYWLTRVDPSAATPRSEDIARIPFAARALAFDGTRFWTNHREQDEIVAFARVE